MYKSDDITVINGDKNITAQKVDELVISAMHDIRSPIGVLNTCLAWLPSISEQDRSLMRTAISRINTIADTLLSEIKIQSKKESTVNG